MFNKQAEKIRQAQKQKYLDGCRKRLCNITETKMKTTFIGAISSIEKLFGFLWGSDLEASERTREQKEFYELWQELRTEILNNGNNQLRALLNEIANHIVQWNRYTATFTITNRNQDNEKDI